MSEKEKKNVHEVCDIYKDLPDYLKGKIDGYAEAIKEKKFADACVMNAQTNPGR